MLHTCGSVGDISRTRPRFILLMPKDAQMLALLYLHACPEGRTTKKCLICVLMDDQLPTKPRRNPQILLQLAASRRLESVCLVNTDEEAALAQSLGAWKATQLKEVRA